MTRSGVVHPTSSVKPDREAPAAERSRSEELLPTLPNGEEPPPPSTLRRPPPPPESSGAIGAARSSLSMARSAMHELRSEEAARARSFAMAIMVLCALGALVEPLLSGDLWVRLVTLACLGAVAYVAHRVWIVARESPRYTRRMAREFGLASLVGATALTYRLGVFSPAPMLTTLAVAFFGLGEDRKLAIGFTALAAASYAAVTALLAMGVLPDAGLMSALVMPPEARVPIIVLVPLVHGMALWHARLSRTATLEAIQRSNEWFREVRQREVQLDEANRDLDMLLKMSAGEIAVHSGATAGKYTLGQRIGRGAMGEIYAARHEEGQVAAIKLLHPSMQEDSLLVQRFLREAEAASKLRAPNVVSVHEVGKLDDGAPYIAMELLRGHDLGWHLRRRGQLSLDEVLGVVDHVATGLEAARVAGVVHRDLKPQNLFLAQQPNAAPVWKILDFGVSRLAGSSGTLTKDIIVGTPGYMSPEQAGGQPATHRSDVFSFGAVVYRALTGEPPFTAADTPQTLYQVVYRNPPRPSELVASLPPDVDLVIAIALAKDPSDRFASALEMAAAFKAAARHALGPELRLHARTLLATLPWSHASRESHAGIEEVSVDSEIEGQRL
jgi:serine/threonine-protein kinase